MVKIQGWFEARCEYGDCEWHSDLLSSREINVCWKQYRDHKHSEHIEKCKGCKFVNFEQPMNKYYCKDKGCTKGRKKEEVW